MTSLHNSLQEDVAGLVVTRLQDVGHMVIMLTWSVMGARSKWSTTLSHASHPLSTSARSADVPSPLLPTAVSLSKQGVVYKGAPPHARVSDEHNAVKSIPPSNTIVYSIKKVHWLSHQSLV